MRLLSLALVLSLFVVVPTWATVTVTSPANGTTVSSPTKFVASATSSRAVTHMNIYVDGNRLYSQDVSSINTSLTLSTGSHTAVVKAWDSAGSVQSTTVRFTVSSVSSGDTSPLSPPSTATTFSRIEEMSGWNMCSECANAGGGATTSMQQGISSPSLDGKSTKFTLGGTTPWSHSLYYKRLTSNSSATNFVYDVSYYYKNPSASSGMEYSISQRVGYEWYRWDTQCSYINGNWRLWDNANVKWVNTTIPCTRPAPYSWVRVVFEGQRRNGKVVFVAITINGQRHYLNQAFGPRKMSTTSSSVTVHFQLNGDKYQTDYQVWGDKFKAVFW